jgi:hypothetical protein
MSPTQTTIDDDIRNFIIEFSGLFSDRCAVDENGHFNMAFILLDGSGIEYLITHDPWGLASNQVGGFLGLT